MQTHRHTHTHTHRQMLIKTILCPATLMASRIIILKHNLII